MITRHILQFLLPAAAVAAVAPPAQAQPRCDAPQVLISVDRSTSMRERLPDGTMKWDAARGAVTAMTTTFDGRVDFGLQIFPYPDACGPGEVTLELGPNGPGAFEAGLSFPPPESGNFTPIAQSMEALLEHAPLIDTMRDNHVVLVTDGGQYCRGQDNAAMREAAITAIERLHAAGVLVHVVGFGAEVSPALLNRAAIAGGTALPGCDPSLTDPAAMNHCYLVASDLTELSAVLDSIGRYVTDESCDGFDNDCDGTVDEGFDADGDGFTTCGTDPSVPGSTDPGLSDCDDVEAAVYPGAAEHCDGLDNDCDGTADPGCDCIAGEDRACGSEVGACVPGGQSCEAGAWATCEPDVGPEPESCDGIDEDCDGTVDEDASCGEGFACMDGACLDLTPPPDPEPIPETIPRMDGGCGCVTAGASGSSAPLAALLGLSLLGVAIKRRRRR